MNNYTRQSNQIFYSQNRTQTQLSALMSRVYAWMTAGILVTGLVSFFVGNNPVLVNKIFSNSAFFWIVIILQFASVIYLTAAIQRISAAAAAITFLMYSALTGLTLSVIFLTYTQESIVSAFLTTAVGFSGLSLYGFMTKRDLGPIGSFCIMGLFGIIGIMLLSLIFPSLMSGSMQFAINVIGLIVFAGLTAYDTQRIKNMSMTTQMGVGQQAIYGALMLYLDFINLFLYILRFVGKQK